jgi:hypothetical protein
MQPIFGFSFCAGRSRIPDALAALLGASTGVPVAQPREGAPGVGDHEKCTGPIAKSAQLRGRGSESPR